MQYHSWCDKIINRYPEHTLYYNGQIAVDTAHHVITHAESFTADGKDCRDLITIATQLQSRLKNHGMQIEKLLADAAYSSGENYEYLE